MGVAGVGVRLAEVGVQTPVIQDKDVPLPSKNGNDEYRRFENLLPFSQGKFGIHTFYRQQDTGIQGNG
jgi:hypothetical protein